MSEIIGIKISEFQIPLNITADEFSGINIPNRAAR